MTRKANQNRAVGRRLGAIVVLITLGLGGGLAKAGAPGRGHDGHRHHAHCACVVSPTAGWIEINGRKTRVTSGRGMLAQLAKTFRSAGYRAWIQDGGVHVDYGRRKPVVRWKAGGYSVQMRWSGCTLGLSLRERSASVSGWRDGHRRLVRPVRRVLRAGVCRR